MSPACIVDWLMHKITICMNIKKATSVKLMAFTKQQKKPKTTTKLSGAKT